MELSLRLRGETECGPKSILLCHRVKVSAGAGGRVTSPWQMEGMPGTGFPSEPPAGPRPQEGRETHSVILGKCCSSVSTPGKMGSYARSILYTV